MAYLAKQKKVEIMSKPFDWFEKPKGLTILLIDETIDWIKEESRNAKTKDEPKAQQEELPKGDEGKSEE